MNIKRINRILFYTLLVFSIFTFSIYPESHSKYIKEDATALIYDLELQSLYKGYNNSIMIDVGTSFEKVNFIFEFERSRLIKEEDESLKYRILVDNKCTITRIDTKGSKSFSNNRAVINYNDNTEDKVNVYYSCNVDDIKDATYLTSNFDVYETYLPDNIEYRYTHGQYKNTLDNFYLMYPRPNESISADYKVLTLPKYVDDKYAIFESWISLYANYYWSEYESELDAYVKEVFTSETDILDLTKTLRGLSIVYDNTTDSYIYTFDDNILGYAATKYALNSNNMYFSNENLMEVEVNEIFVYYLENYVYPDDLEVRNRVYNYIMNSGGLYNVMFGDSKIVGVTYNSELKRVNISNNIISIINATESSPIYTEYDNRAINMINNLKAGLQAQYLFITDEVMNYISTNASASEFASYWTKKNQAFDEYFVITPVIENSTNTYAPILFHIYSPYVESDTETHRIYISATELISGMNVEMSYSASDIESAKNDLTAVNTALGTTKVLEDDMFITSGSYVDGYYETIVDPEKITIKFIVE